MNRDTREMVNFSKIILLKNRKDIHGFSTISNVCHLLHIKQILIFQERLSEIWKNCNLNFYNFKSSL